MIQHIIQFLDLAAYAFIASQAMFYLLAMSKTVKEMRPESFVEFKNLLDSKLQISLRFVYYSALFISPVWCYVAVRSHKQLIIITSFIALLALSIDICFLLKGNQPINKVFQTWNRENYPENWEEVKQKWFMQYHRRQIAGLLGFFCLLIGAVFR
jgi:hypothetical protein